MNRLFAVLLGFLSTSAWAESRGVVADILVTHTSVIPEDEPLERDAAGEFAQDVMGRTRLEWDGQITISDPVDGVFWRVDIAKGVAFRRDIEPAKPAGEDLPGTKTLPLGRRVINGVECEGVSSKREIPTAAMGNAAPIHIVTETWTTHAFGFPLAVLTVIRDAHSGTQKQELRNIREVVFDAATFRPDARVRIAEGRK